jgi:hypothetical protein
MSQVNLGNQVLVQFRQQLFRQLLTYLLVSVQDRSQQIGVRP